MVCMNTNIYTDSYAESAHSKALVQFYFSEDTLTFARADTL